MVALGWLAFHLYLTESPVPKQRASIALRTGPALTEQLVVVVVDGLREDVAFNKELMPTFNRLAASGASGVNITPPMTLTTISVLTMATGKEPGISWALKNFDSETYQDESVMSVASEGGVRVALVGDASWTQLFGVHAKHTLAIPDHGFYHGGAGDMAQTDAQVFDEALATISQKTPAGKPMYPMVVVHVIGSDKTAHKSGAHMVNPDGTRSAYARSCHAIDAAIGRLVDKGNPAATWLVLSDHGVNKWGSHGGGEKEARRAPFALSGPGVNAATGVEKPLTSVASECTALLGVRPPRTATTQANYRLLSMTPSHEVHHRRTHLLARLHTAKAALSSTDASQTIEAIDVELKTLRKIEPEHADGWLADVQSLWQQDNEERRWARPTGLLFGFAIQWLLIWLIGRACGTTRNAWKATAWCLLLWIGCRFSGGWDFRTVEFLGEFAASWRQFGIRAGVLLGLVGLYTIGIQKKWISSSLPDELGWILWAGFVFTMGQSVMIYPYGPLSQMYGVLTLIFLLLLVRSAVSDRTNRIWWIIALAGVLFLMSGQNWIFDVHDRRLSETWWSTGIADCLLFLCLFIWFWMRRKTATPPSQWMVRGGFVVLALVAVWVHRDAPSWVARGFLLAGPLLVISMIVSRPNPTEARNSIIALGLILYRALSTDPRFMMLLALAVVAIALSLIQHRQRHAAVPYAAAFALLAHHTFFYWVGHSYSFSDIDVTVVFTATKDAIHLGEGFAMILLQHLGPWLVIAAALVFHFAKQANRKALTALALAVPGAYLIQGVGAFGSFEYQLDNYWFTLHALPLFIFAMCNAFLAGLATSITLALYNQQN